MFAAVAVVGVQTLSKVDFNDHRNAVIVGTSLGLAMLATAQPYVSAAVPPWASILFGSGITLGALTAILLNVLFMHLRGSPHTAVAGKPGAALIGLDEVNTMSAEAFANIFGHLVQDSPWALHRAYARRPFADTSALRSAFQDALLTGSEADQLQLLNAFPDLGSDPPAADAYAADHEAAGLGAATEETHAGVAALARAYRTHFGFPLIVCAREVERYERTLANGWLRLDNATSVERAAAMIEVARIAGYRFGELVADANPVSASRLAPFARDQR
jgi:OHCU decarboxylase